MAQHRHAVRQRDEPQCQEFIEPDRLLVAAAQVHHQLADQRSERRAQRQAAAEGPQHVDHPPAPAPGPQFVQAEQAQAEHHKRERGTIVQRAFAGQAEAQAVAVTGVLDLHVGGQYRVGGREDAAQQHRCTQRQAQGEHGDQHDRPDRQAHGHEGQPQRQAPVRVGQRQTELQAGGKQRDHDRDLGQPFEQHRVQHRVGRHQAPAGRAQRHADHQVQHRGADRQALEQRAAQGHRRQQRAEDHGPDRERHRAAPGRGLSRWTRAGAVSRGASCPGTRRVRARAIAAGNVRRR